MTDLQQRCYERLAWLHAHRSQEQISNLGPGCALGLRFEQLRQSPAVMRKADSEQRIHTSACCLEGPTWCVQPLVLRCKVLPYDASCEDIIVNKARLACAVYASQHVKNTPFFVLKA